MRDEFRTQWYSESRFLVKVFDIEEFFGYEESILDILKGIKSISSFSELREHIISQIMPRLRNQIEGGGNTAFLDIDKMKDEESARLVPIILEKRREHFLAATERFCLSQKNLDDVSDMLSTNYGFNVVKAINKEIESLKAVDYIVTHLDNLYENLKKSQKEKTDSSSTERSDTKWIRLIKQIVIGYIARLTDMKFEVRFQYCNPALNLLYESGFRDIFKDLSEIQSYPKLYKKEFWFIKSILKGIKTKRTSQTLQLITTSEWQGKYLQT